MPPTCHTYPPCFKSGLRPLMRLHEAHPSTTGVTMNIFTAIGTVLKSLTSMVVELCNAGESTARVIHKTVSIAEVSVDSLLAEQQQELDEILALASPPPPTNK